MPITHQLGGVLGAIGGYLFVVYFGYIWGFILIVIPFIGIAFAGWYVKRKKMNKKFISIIVWSSIVTGLILPPIGLLISSAAYTFGARLNPSVKKYKIIGIIGILLALSNGALGVYLKLNRYI